MRTVFSILLSAAMWAEKPAVPLAQPQPPQIFKALRRPSWRGGNKLIVD